MSSIFTFTRLRYNPLAFLLFIILASVTVQLSAQSVYRIELKVVAYGNNYWDSDSKGARYRLSRETTPGSNTWTNLMYIGCLSANKGQTVYPDRALNSFDMDVNGPREFKFLLGTHHERKDDSDPCSAQGTSDVSFNHPDLWNMDEVHTINFSQLTPGVFVSVPRLSNISSGGGPESWVDLQIRYSILRPEMPRLLNAGSFPSNICPNQLLTLKTKNQNFNQSGIKYRWEYMVAADREMIANPEYCGPADPVQGCGHMVEYWETDPYDGHQSWVSYWQVEYCCDLQPVIPKGTWHELTNTLPANSPYADSIVFNPLADIFSNTLNETRSVYFRVRAYNQIETYWSDVMSLSFSPPPPSLGEVPITTASCSNGATGTITINNIAGVGTYTYMLNAGYDDTVTHCDPAVQNCVGFGIASGYFSGNTLTLSNIPAGKYTLRIANPGDSLGTCYAYQNVKVDSFTLVALTVDTFSRSVSCNGAQDGFITLSSTGGNRSSITYTVKNTVTLQTYSNSTGVFINMPKGNYQVMVADACNQLSYDLLVIGEPTTVNGILTINNATCTNPENGSISIIAQRGSGRFDYLLKKAGTTIASLSATNDTIWSYGNLQAGDYTVFINDADRPYCAGFQQNFTIQPAPGVGLSLSTMEPISCYGAGNGYLRFETGIGGNFQYYLLNTTTQVLQTNTVGKFSDLPGGNYMAYVKNESEGCLDSAAYKFNPIAMPDPSDIEMTFDVQSITCKGGNDGSIRLTNISGGRGTVVYRWEKKQNGSWYDYTDNGQGTGDRLTNLYPGTFRLVVSDDFCKKWSEEFQVVEPNISLVLTSVTVTNIKCLNESGKIIPVAGGGYGGYKYYFTASGGSATEYNPATYNFSSGTYSIKVRDSLGCEVVYPDPITITAPSAALAFTTTLSNYNGFHVSCFGNINGKITVNASGGNGGAYSGYEYSLGNISGPYRSSNVFDSLAAGAKIIYVRDARGCIVSQTVTLTQPASTIIATSTFTNPVCANDSTASITVTASGGVPPYQYKMVKTGTTGAWWENYQSSNVFNNIVWGLYTITVKDANGCTRVTTRILSYKSTGPVIAVAKQDINCFAENTGSIGVSVTSGINKVTPYVYTWTGVSSSASTVSSIPAGTYAVRVADSLGCKKDSVIILTQPTDLQNAIVTRPICIGSSDGKITISASGGVAPYTYSNNGGSSFQASNEFAGLTAGTYAIRTKDANNCIDAVSVPIVTRNVGNTYINFLVSSMQNAYDTIVVKEVCNPKPDSIKWEFDASAVVLDNNQFSPRIRFNQAGNYRIKMIPYFGGCDLPVEKFVQIRPFDSTIVFSNPNLSGIDTVMVMPNPNNGQFSLQVKLLRQQKLDVYIRSVNGTLLYYRHWNSVKEIMETINLNGSGAVAAGTYFLKVFTDNDARDVIIIKQ